MTAPATTAPLVGVTPSQLGMVVENLDVAMDELGRLLGCEWQVLRDGRALIPYRTRGGVRELPVRGAESLNGPPYLELLQAIPGTVWEPRGVSYLHHMAYEVPDLEAAAVEVERQGFELVLTQVGPGRLQTFALYQAPHGGLFEIVDGAAVAGRRRREGVDR